MITEEDVMDPIAAKGTIGTSISFMLADVSVVISILVGIVTLAYMTEKWLAMRAERKGKECNELE